MKAQSLFIATGLLILFAGCQENAVAPIDVRSNPKQVPAFRALQIKENIEFMTPEGYVGVAEVTGEVTYSLAPVQPAVLGKEIPPERRQIYDLNITGKGAVVPLGRAPVENGKELSKPETWSFAGQLTSIVEDGSRGINVVFTISGTRWSSHYHVSFILSDGFLNKAESVIDFHQNLE